MKQFKLKVVLCNKEEHVFELDERRAAEVGKIWTHGLRIQKNATTWELISPFVIQSAILIEVPQSISE